MLISLPENDVDFMERKIILAEELHVIVIKLVVPAIVVPFLNPLAVTLNDTISLTAERLGFFLKLAAGVDDCEQDLTSQRNQRITNSLINLGRTDSLLEEVLVDYLLSSGD